VKLRAGISASPANAVLLTPMAASQPERVVALFASTDRRSPYRSTSYLEFTDLMEPAADVLSEFAIYGLAPVDLQDETSSHVAAGTVSGPQETDLRLSLRTDTANVEALLEVFPEPDTATLSGAFFGRRLAGRSRRGLPLWEMDAYRRATRVAWGATTRLYPFGQAREGQRRAIWLEVKVSREFVGGQTRPEETVTISDSSAVALTLEAVVRPRRAAVRLTLVRGDTASAPQLLDIKVRNADPTN